jgi:dihydroxyacetone kinase-like protein
MADTIQGQAVADAVLRASNALNENSAYLTELDQALGDGDTGITLGKIATALIDYVNGNSVDDLGNYLAKAGMAANKAAPSTLGTLLATALMRAGKEVKSQTKLSAQDLVNMFNAADDGIQQRGKAKLGDKTIVDAIHPASVAFSEAVAEGVSLKEAGVRALGAAEEGRDQVTPLRSQVGRASWVGERTEGKVDPGCAAFVIMLSAVVEPSTS